MLVLELEPAYNNHEHFIELEVNQSVSVVDGDRKHVQSDGMSDDQNDTILGGIYRDFFYRDHENHVRCKYIEG